MTIEILDAAEADLVAGYRFYEAQREGLGAYFVASLLDDIRRLETCAGVHMKLHDYHRALSRRFPWAIYYLAVKDLIRVVAILDCRSNPVEHHRRLTS